MLCVRHFLEWDLLTLRHPFKQFLELVKIIGSGGSIMVSSGDEELCAGDIMSCSVPSSFSSPISSWTSEVSCMQHGGGNLISALSGVGCQL